MKSRMKRRILSFAFGVICLAGFVYQVVHISCHFFQFKTSSRVHQGVVDLLKAPNVVLCFRYFDLFNYTLILSDSMSGKARLDKAFRNITVRQVFRYTPKASHLLSSIWYRESDSFVLRNASTLPEMKKIFRSNRYIIQDRICYRLLRRKRNKMLFTFPRLTYSLHFPGIFYELILDPYFTRADKIRIMVLHSDEYPYLSHIYSSMTSRTDDVMGREANISSSNLLISFRHIVHNLQPKPWDTGCVNRDLSFSNKNCRSCLQKYLDPVTNAQKVPFTEYINSVSDMSLISEQDLENKTLDDVMVKMARNCKTICYDNPCLSEFSITSKTLTAAISSPSPHVRIKIQAPSNPPITITSEQKLSYKEYFNYITSCFGLWFGLSMATASPFNYCYHRLKKKRRKRPTTTLLTRLFM